MKRTLDVQQYYFKSFSLLLFIFRYSVEYIPQYCSLIRSLEHAEVLESITADFCTYVILIFFGWLTSTEFLFPLCFQVSFYIF